MTSPKQPPHAPGINVFNFKTPLAPTAAPKTTRFKLHGSPQSRSIARIGQNGLSTLLCGGIINPFGPTLNAIALDGPFEAGKELPIVYMNLNPFSQEAKEVGIAQIGETWNPAVDLLPFFSMMFGSCPTLLLPSSLLDSDEAVAIYSLFLATFDDGLSQLKKVPNFPGDPWNRIQQDVNGLEDVAQRIRSRRDPVDDKPKLNAEEARELAENLLNPKNLKLEIQAFFSHGKVPSSFREAVKWQSARYHWKSLQSISACSRFRAICLQWAGRRAGRVMTLMRKSSSRGGLCSNTPTG